MIRNNYLRYTLELIVILGYLIIGVTVFTYTVHRVPMDNVFIGSIVFAIGVIEFTDFFTWKYLTRIRSIQSAFSALVCIALGAVFIFIKMDMELLCILLGANGINSSLARTITASLNLNRQPLLNVIKIILSLIEIVFSILLIIRTLNSLYAHMVFIGVALFLQTFTLVIEFIVHRYQRI